MRQRGNLLARNNLQNIRVVGSFNNDCCDLNNECKAECVEEVCQDRSLDSGSQRNVESAPKKLPSFLYIPEENDDA